MGVFFYGWLVGREQYWNGPFFTGYIGFGDDSVEPGGLEKLSLALGVPIASRDLYYYDHADEFRVNQRPPRQPRELTCEGIRGRGDDPLPRKLKCTRSA